MPQFQNTEQALDFLIGLVLSEADREGVELSPVETQMLAYSAKQESRFATLNAAFEDECSEIEYEDTVSSLIRNLLQRNDVDQAAWDEAVERLGEDDFYLTVMIEMAKTTRPSFHPSAGKVFDRFKLFATAVTIVTAFLILLILFARK